MNANNIDPAILIIDHSRVVLKLMERFASNCYQGKIITARNGTEALKILAENSNIRVIITDLWMTRTDGFSLLKTLQQSPNQRINLTPVIIITSHQIDTPVLNKLSKLGAFGILKKPLEAQKFYSLLTEALNSWQGDSAQHLNIVSVDQQQVFTVSQEDELNVRGNKELALASESNRTACLVTIRIRDHARRRSEIDTIIKITQKVLQNNLRETDFYARTGSLGFMYMINGKQYQSLQRRTRELQKQLVTQLKECQQNNINTNAVCYFVNQRDYTHSFLQIYTKCLNELNGQRYNRRDYIYDYPESQESYTPTLATRSGVPVSADRPLKFKAE